MTEPDLYLEAENARRRKWWTVLGASVVAGFVTGLGFVVAEEGDGFLTGTIPAWLAVALSALYLVMMLYGTIMMKRVTDEVEIHNNLWGLAIGGSAIALAYPVWWLLWRGQVLPEPGHEMLFLLMFVSSLVGYLWKKYR